MPPEVEVDAPTETTSAEGAPEDVTGTPPEDGGESEPPEPTEPQEGDEGHPEPTAAEETAFAKLRAKYPNMSDEEFQETVAENYWNATREISSREKGIKERDARIAQLEAALAEKEPPEPEEPVSNPQIERLDKRIKSLYDRGQSFQQEQQSLLQELPKVDREIAKAEARIEDAGDGEYGDAVKRTKYEQLKANLELKKEGLVRQIRDLHYKREQADFEMETLLADKDWMTKVSEQQRNQAKLAEQSREQFNTEFPKYVDGLIEQAADALKAPKDEKIRESLWKHVNRAVTMDFWSMANKGLDQVDVPELVQEHVKEYLEDRDLIGRHSFQKRSEEKLAVSSRASQTGRSTKPTVKSPVPISRLGGSNLTPGMAAARKYLSSKGL